MKVYCATLVHESSRCSPIPTDIGSFAEDGLYRPSTGEGEWLRSETLIGVNWGEILRARGHEIAWGLLASAEPSRPASAAAYADLRGELLDSLRAAGPVDFVVLFLHGAQVAEGTDDVAGDILAGVRTIVGAETPVGVLFDLHGNISDVAIACCDVMLSCLEYPHTDFGSRAAQLVDLLERTARREIGPVLARQRVPMLGTYFTTRQPMRGFVDRAKSFEGQNAVLAVSLSHGFAWADVEACGASVLVCVDGDREAAASLAETLAGDYFALRDVIRTPLLSAESAVAQAMAHPEAPVIIADISDNPGGGAAGDSTWLLRALLDAGARDCGVGMIWDAGAVDIARRAGVGARLPLRIGGKVGAASGMPVDLDVCVRAVRDDAVQVVQGLPTRIGPAAVVEAEGIAIVLCAVRQQVFDTACFEAFGIRLAEQRIVVVKSHQHFRERFADVAAHIVYATPPGTVCTDYAAMRFDRIPRPIWPIDAPPFTAFSKPWS